MRLISNFVHKSFFGYKRVVFCKNYIMKDMKNMKVDIFYNVLIIEIITKNINI